MMLTEVAAALGAAGVRFAVAGGHAVALHGAVRGTVDLDLVVFPDESDYVETERALVGLGLRSRLPVDAREVFRFRREYRENRNLVAWSFVDANDPTRLVDVILTWDERRLPRKHLSVAGVDVPLLSRAALIRMKEASGRPQDLEDVAALRRLGRGR
ncbi:MAG TPA: hypothetical protein RMF84_14630 [Polyangiaceae bacterium LLY-WYZ-14_1]|nr:hypothetical protein [Polyangiaceae bacterium LLY-WYZ-14_1]